MGIELGSLSARAEDESPKPTRVFGISHVSEHHVVELTGHIRDIYAVLAYMSTYMWGLHAFYRIYVNIYALNTHIRLIYVPYMLTYMWSICGIYVYIYVLRNIYVAYMWHICYIYVTYMFLIAWVVPSNSSTILLCNTHTKVRRKWNNQWCLN